MIEKTTKNNYIFFFFLLIISPLQAAEIIIQEPGSFKLMRTGNDVALVHLNHDTGMQTTRVLPPTLFPLTAIIQSGSATNQDIIQNLVTIAANNVIFNINGFNLAQGLVIKGNNVRVSNGLIDPTALQTGSFDATAFYISNGINILPGSADVSIDGVTVRNATSGILFNQVSGGLVSNCEIILSSTGLELNQSNNIVVENCTATQCRQIGFNLVLSTTNCLSDCTALATGAYNTGITNNNVCGFSSQNGSGNIFERCIANATQAVSTTDYNSIIAGFLLTGVEQYTKIIDCEGANSSTNASGVTVPYGILLQATLNNPITLTAVPPLPVPGDDVESVNWSPDGVYLAVGIALGDSQRIRIYGVNRMRDVVAQVATPDVIPGGVVFSVNWSPDSKYVAAGVAAADAQRIRVYNFNPINNSLIQVATPNVIPGAAVSSVSWSFDGNYLAAGISSADSQRIRIYKFDRVAQSLNQVATPDVIPGGTVKSVSWSPDGRYLAIGAVVGDAQRIRIYSFNGASNLLTQVATPNVVPTDVVNSVDWSPDGKYLVAGIGSGDSQRIRVYSFDYAALTLNQVATPNVIPADSVYSADWSPDGRYIAVGTETGDSQIIRVYNFNPGISSLNQGSTPNIIPGSAVFSVNWSPDGQFLAAGVAGGDSQRIKLYNSLTFPSNNVIKNNTVYCNSGARFPSGVGISGSSIANMIIQNIAYTNPVLQAAYQPIVESNYQFVCNVFNELFGDGPTALQNISLTYLVPIVVPADQGLLAQQLKFKLFSFNSVLDHLVQEVSALDFVGCFATSIMAPTTINQSGIYCLNNAIIGNILIAASNVVLDLNGKTITGAVQVNSSLDQITMRNGLIANSGGTAITINSGVTNIDISKIIATNSLIGMNLQGVNSGTVSNCTFTQNTTGIQLNSSANIMIADSTALSNKNAGFDLVLSTTCSLIDCKAFGTGQGNTNILNQTIIGFSASNGKGNIFERCIANGTQALSTTDSQSIVAGFMFTGTERCSKIIDCESSNAITSASGVTVPYGILLQATLSGLVSVTSVNPGDGVTTDQVLSVAWSPDGQYLAVGGTISGATNSNDLFIYRFDFVAQTLQQVDSINPGGFTTSVFSVAWSPDGQYLAIGKTFTGIDNINNFIVYSFDRNTQTLQELVELDLDGGSDVVNSVAWSPDGGFLAVGGDIAGATGNDLWLYRFDRVAQTLTVAQSLNPQGGSFVDVVRTLAWSPDGKFLALGGAPYGSVNDLILYRFDRDTQTLQQVDSLNPDGAGIGDQVRSVAWSFDGQYLAVGGFEGGGTSNELFIYRLDRGTQKLQLIVSANASGGSGFDQVNSVAWSPNGQYLAVGGTLYGTTGNDLIIFRFDRGTQTLQQVDSLNPDGGAGDNLFAVAWSPDGQYLAVGGTINGTTNNALFIYRVLTFPSKNVIQGNTVYCNSGAQYPSGVGISGSSIANMIIQNTAYSNPAQQSPNHPIVPSNYTFVCNVFDQQFQNMPTLLQNIAMGDDQPISMPQDEALLAKQFGALAQSLGVCGPTAITSGTTISTGGRYCLATDITGDISITTTCAILDLNNRSVTGLISVSNADDAQILNGFITPPAPTANTPSPAISIASTCNRVVVSNVSINCAASSGSGIQGRDAFQVAGNDTQILACTLIGGDASNRTTAGVGIRGGHAISLVSDATKTFIQGCLIQQTGMGGAANTATNAGGDAGNGINVASGATGTQISNCTILQTGVGGNAVGATNGGSGGNGIFINSGAFDTEVRNCRIANTGTGGTGTPAGVPGKAVFDLVTTTSHFSSILQNFAHNITNPTKFDIQAPTIAGGPEDGVITPNPPTSGVINLFANVYSS